MNGFSLLLAAAFMASPAMAGDFSVSQSSGNSIYVLCQGSDCPLRTTKILDIPAPEAKTEVEIPAVSVPQTKAPSMLVLQFGLSDARLGEANRLKLSGFGKAAGVSARYSVVGSTDRLGGLSFNRLLAVKRAQSVAHALRKLGVAKQNINIESRCCIENPPAVNPDARRVVIRVIE
jgi:outer membrane protein OmpA-like peptidoglycan-associated protein